MIECLQVHHFEVSSVPTACALERRTFLDTDAPSLATTIVYRMPEAFDAFTERTQSSSLDGSRHGSPLVTPALSVAVSY